MYFTLNPDINNMDPIIRVVIKVELRSGNFNIIRRVIAAIDKQYLSMCGMEFILFLYDDI